MLARVVPSFTAALGSTAGPLAIAGIVAIVGARLAGSAYDRWVARVLNAPYTPELFPPTVIDAAVAMSILRASPVFAKAFASEIGQ